MTSPHRGLVPAVGPADHTFACECVRHLVGGWWAFTGDPAGVTGYADCRGVR